MTREKEIWPQPTLDKLIDEIEQFISTHDLSDETFGWRAAKDSALLPRLRLGGDVTTKKMDRIRAFMDDYPNT